MDTPNDSTMDIKSVIKKPERDRIEEQVKEAKLPTEPTPFMKEYRALCLKYGEVVNSCSCCGIWVTDADEEKIDEILKEMC